jgi:hypothetical protein
LLDLFVCPQVDLVEVLTEAVEQPANFFRHPCHGEKLVRRIGILTRCGSAPAAKPVDKVPGLICRNTARQPAQFVDTIDQLCTF